MASPSLIVHNRQVEWCSHPATEDRRLGWESQRRGRRALMLDRRRKANGVGTHSPWREVCLVQNLKEEWDFNR